MFKKKNKNEIQIAKSKVGNRKRISDNTVKGVKVTNIVQGTESVKRIKSGKLIEVKTTTLQLEHAGKTIGSDPKLARNIYITSYNQILSSNDFIGIDFIAVQTSITGDFNQNITTLIGESKKIIDFMWKQLASDFNISISGMVLEVISVNSIKIPFINTGLKTQDSMKKTISMKEFIALAKEQGIIPPSSESTKFAERFFDELISAVKFGYIVNLNNVVLMRKDQGNENDLSFIPSEAFFKESSRFVTKKHMGNKKTFDIANEFDKKNK